MRKANGFAVLAIGAIAALDVYCAIKLAQQRSGNIRDACLEGAIA